MDGGNNQHSCGNRTIFTFICAWCRFLLLSIRLANLTKEGLMSKSKLKYVLFWFSAKGDELVGEESLPNVTAEQVAEWFFLPDGDSLMDAYIVRASQRLYLSKLAKHKINLNKFDYFVELR